jgi:proteasome lid subunit RPN8/RPN11
MQVTEDLKNKLIEIAHNHYPLECCGLVLKDDTIIESENKAKTPKYDFMIDSKLFWDYSGKIKAVYHSHCTKADVSEADFKMPKIYERILINVGIDNPSVKCY